MRDAVAACIDRRYVGDRAAVAALTRALGTRLGEGSVVKCRGGIPDIGLIDAQGKAVLLTFCAQLGVREARVGGFQTIFTKDPAAVEGWLLDHGVDVRGMR